MKIILILLPQILVLLIPLSGWQLMVSYIVMMFVALKLATLIAEPAKDWQLTISYSFFWPGMNIREFKERYEQSVNFTDGTISLLVGILLASVALLSDGISTLLFAFLAMFFLFHFGALDLLARLWQKAGRNVKPIMAAPWKAQNLADFWGKRWNLAFRDGVHKILYKPVSRKAGSKAGIFVVFLYSGIVHEAVISVAASGGYGGPTVYFIIQFLAILAQREFNYLQKFWFTWATILLPTPLLFHEAFFLNVLIPILNQGG